MSTNRWHPRGRAAAPKWRRSPYGRVLVLAASASVLLLGCAEGGSSGEEALRKQVDELESQVSTLKATTTAPARTSTSAAPTTTTPPTTTTSAASAPYGGLVASLPEGDTSDYADWSFPLPGPSKVTTPLQLNTEGPFDAEYFTATISDPAVGFDDVQAFLRAVPAAQGWEGHFELPSGESSHSLGSWSFFSPDGLFIYLDIFDPAVAEGTVSAPAMTVTFSFTDG